MIKPSSFILFFLFTANQIFGQNATVRETIVDSLTFVNNRKLLNSLNTANFQKYTFEKNGIQIPYRLLRPVNRSKKEKYPLVITLHNSTRIGNDNENQLEPLAKIWLRDEISSQFPCFVLAPQFGKRSSNYKKNSDSVLVSKPADEVFTLLKLIKKVRKNNPAIDKNRIYLVGYSMGASTAQNLMNIAPDQFAAMVSVAAVPDFSNLDQIKQKNIWLIHGRQDDENPYQGSVELYNKLKSNQNLNFTTFANLNHNSIVIPFLLTDEIPKWLFGKHD